MPGGIKTFSVDSPWRLPCFSLTPQQKSLLASHFSPPTNADVNAMPKHVRDWYIKKWRKHTALLEMRLAQSEWVHKNEELLKQALNDDEQAFFELIERDPRYLCCDLGLLYISRWTSAIDVSNSFGPIGKGVATKNRNNIKRISRMLLRPFDRRGKRSLPDETQVKTLYYAALFLFRTLKRLARWQPPQHRRTWTDKFRRHVALIPSEEIDFEKPEGFLYYVRGVDQIISQLGEGKAEFNSSILLVSPPHYQAVALVAKVFNIEERTIRRFVRSDAMIHWPTPKGYLIAVPRPRLDLEHYPSITKMLARNKSDFVPRKT